MIYGGYLPSDVPTGQLDNLATMEALTFPMPACEGECGNPASVARFDATSARFIALCVECEPIPFELVNGGQ